MQIGHPIVFTESATKQTFLWPTLIFRISRKSMCLSINLCKSEQKVFNI